MPDIAQVISFLFLMLGPFKILAPFASITRGADKKLTRQIAVRATIFSSVAILLAAFIGENMLTKFGIPMPIMSIAGGLILFLVALLNIIRQFAPIEEEVHATPANQPSLRMAISPLAFPTIVTPYGIAAVIAIMAMYPDQKNKLIVGVILLGIMVINLVFMLVFRYIAKPLSIALPILGAILGVVQVSLGLQIIYRNLQLLLSLS